MENPQSWGLAEHVVDEAIQQWTLGRSKGQCGYSQAMQITTALRREGLLKEEDSDGTQG